jgi:hypothetical protein
MSSTRIKIKNAEITPEGILIRSMEIIDGESGENLRIAKLTPELLDYLKMIEISVDDYFKCQEMKKQNPAFTKLCENFKLYT